MKNFIIKNLKWAVLILIGLGILALLSFLVHLAATRDSRNLESILLQIISLAIGSSVSFWIGQKSVEKAAKEIIKPHARSAFRRLIFLYLTLRHAANMIESSQSSESREEYHVVLARLEEIVTAQLLTADDALEDWNDIVPEDVEELKQKLESEDTMEDRQ